MTTASHPERTPQDERGAPALADRSSLSRVAVASTVGTTIEFYDLFIYGTAAALVFPTVFFTSHGTLASFATYAVAFFARPFGSILFGHFGDRVGRKRTLIATLLLMGIATASIGLLPGYATGGVFGIAEDGIGVWAPVLLVLLRLVQGLAVGGEWAGAVVLASEHAPPEKRGFYTLFPQMGPPLAFALSSATFLIVNQTVGEAGTAFVDYGWRIPFIASLVLILVGLWARTTITEAGVFKAEPIGGRAPIVQAISNQPREIALCGGALASLFSIFYVSSAFLTSYGTAVLGFSRAFILTNGVAMGLFFALAVGFSSALSDLVGRRRLVQTSCALAIPWGLLLFPVLDTGSRAAFVSVIAVGGLIFGFAFGPAGAWLSEMFETRYRYSGAGFSYNIASILGAAIPPLVAARILETGGASLWIGVMLAGLSTVSLLCTFGLTDDRGRSLVGSRVDATA